MCIYEYIYNIYLSHIHLLWLQHVSDTLLCISYSGAACPQDWPVIEHLYSSLDMVIPPVSMSEDCLFLEVYTPSLTARRPVMVWIHGGGFALGEKYD